MKRYQVIVSPRTHQQILSYAQHIAEASGSVTTAERWVDKMYETIARLDYFPHRYGLAEEDAHRDNVIHRQIIGNYLALYSIDDDARVVSVIGFRHGKRLPLGPMET